MSRDPVQVERAWAELDDREAALRRLPPSDPHAAALRLHLAWDRLDLLEHWPTPTPPADPAALRSALVQARGLASPTEQPDPWTCAPDPALALSLQQALLPEQAAATYALATADPGDPPAYLAALTRMVQVKEQNFRQERYALTCMAPGPDPRAAALHDRQLTLLHDLAAGLTAQRHTLAEQLHLHGDPTHAALARAGLRDGVRAWLRHSDDAALHAQEARLFDDLGRYDLALQHAEQAIASLSGLHAPAALVDAHTARAELWSWLGDHERALSEAEAAQHQLDRLSTDEAPAADSAGLFGWMLDAVNRGLQSLAASLERERQRQAIVHLRCHAHRQLGRWHEARSELLGLREATRADVRFAIDWQLAELALRSGDSAEALRLATPLPQQAEGTMGAHKRPLLLQTLGEAQLATGHPEGLDLLRHAYAIATTQSSPREAWRTGAALADALARQGHLPEALTTWLLAARHDATVRTVPLGHRLDSTRLRAVRPVVERAVRVAAHLHDADAACELIERLKSRALLATLSAPATPGHDPRHDELITLSAALDALYRQASDAGWTPERHARVEQLRRDRDNLLQRVRLHDPRWHALTEPADLHLPTLDALIRRAGLATLTLFDLGDRVVTVLRDEAGAAVHSVPIAEPTRRALHAWTSWLTAPLPTPHHRDPADDPLLDADSFVPAPLLARALRASQLVIAPHGALHLLPWAGLRFCGRRLFEHTPVSVTPSLSLLPLLATPFSACPQLAAFGAPAYGSASGLRPLVGAAWELDRIEQLYRQAGALPTPAVLGPDATEAAWWRLFDQLGPTSVLHLACHGDAPATDPLAAGLALGDGRVEAAELLLRHTPCSEVVLSACSIGQRPTAVAGVELLGDDVLGMPAAWLEAGARAVLVSLPTADDEATVELMCHYHQARLRGAHPAKALQTAQLHLLDQACYPPARWLGFTLYGGVHLD